MSGLAEIGGLYGFAQGYSQVAPNDIDQYTVLNTNILTTSTTWVGTAAGGTSTQAKPLVLINTYLDHPRNLLYSQVGTSDMGGTWVVNGYDQFGQFVTETVGNGTVAAGTPAWAVAGTKVFMKVTSGTFTTATGALGAGSPRIGVAIGTGGTTAMKLGLMQKIGGTADVKSINWYTQNVPTTLNGGTVGALIDATNHAFRGTSIMAGTESYKVILKSTFNNVGRTPNAGTVNLSE